jgi:GNAT superfamily N-acetyltransferase
MKIRLLDAADVAGVLSNRRGIASRVGELRRRVSSLGLARVLLGALRGRLARCWSLREFRMYGLSASEVPKTESGADLRRDAVDDLLLYRPFSANEMTLKDFLAEAVQRLEEGQHVYTFAADGVLLHYSWLIERTGRAGSEFGHEFGFPDPAAVLWSDYTWPDARGRGLQTRSIHRRLRDAVAAGHTRMFIGVRAENAVSRHNIEKVGFRHWASGWAEYRCGRVKRWITYAPMGEAAGAAALVARHGSK